MFITEKIIKYLIEAYYEEHYNPYTAENWQYNYCFQYSFTEWYYLYRLQARLGGTLKVYELAKNIYKYKHTPEILLIGHDKLKVNIF